VANFSNDFARAAEIAEILKALSHPVRLQIIALLCEGEATVSALTDKLGVAQTVVSQQLRILRMSNLVEFKRVGGFAEYRIAEPRLAELIHCLEGCRSGGH
jgi:DNA-binding transcriptional ArsR family regulator